MMSKFIFVGQLFRKTQQSCMTFNFVNTVSGAVKFNAPQYTTLSRPSYENNLNKIIKCNSKHLNSLPFNVAHFSAKQLLETDKYIAFINETKQLCLKSMMTIKMQDLAQVPHYKFWYGVAGLIPFVVPSIAIGFSEALATLQLYYGAIICSFVGGIRWGDTMPEGSPNKPTMMNLGLSVIPAIIGVFGLIVPQQLGYLVIAAGLATSVCFDLTYGSFPPWFKSLRVLLGGIAIFTMLLVFLRRLIN